MEDWRKTVIYDSVLDVPKMSVGFTQIKIVAASISWQEFQGRSSILTATSGGFASVFSTQQRLYTSITNSLLYPIKFTIIAS